MWCGSALCVSGRGAAQVLSIGGDAPAAVSLASDDRGAAPTELYPLAIGAATSDTPLAEDQGNAVGRNDRANPDGQRKPQVYQPTQDFRDLVSRPVRVVCPRPQRGPGLVLGQRGLQIAVADCQADQFHCLRWPTGNRRCDRIGHLCTCLRVLTVFPPWRDVLSTARQDPSRSRGNPVARGETLGADVR